MKKYFIPFALLLLFNFSLIAQNVPEYNVKVENFKFTENHVNAHYKGILLQFDFDLFCRQQGKEVQLAIVPKLIDENKSEITIPQDVKLIEKIPGKYFFNKHYIRKKAEIFIPYILIKKWQQKRILELQLHYKIAERPSIRAFAQEVNFKIPLLKQINPANQVIQVDNVNVKEYFHPTQKIYGLRITFNCNFKYGFDEIIGSDTNRNNAVCIVVPKISLKNQDIFPQSIKQGLQQEIWPKRNALKSDVYAYPVEFFIPFHQIAGDGSFKALLSLDFFDANKKFQFPFRVEKLIDINKSAAIQYQNQEFIIKKLNIQQDVMSDAQHGMLINFDVQPKYVIKQIAGADTNADLQNYYFFAELFNNQNQKVFPDAQITRLSVLNARKVLRPVNKIPYKLQLFIPYRCINLAEGLHDIHLKLHAENRDSTIVFSDIFQQSFSYQQPQKYLLNVDVEQLTVPEGNYDVSAKNVPILNLFIGKKSKAGKGKPDLFWAVAAGSERLFVSPVSKNSLQVIHDKAKVIITDKDVLKLKVYDQDVLSYHDFIGEMDLVHQYGESSSSLNAIKAEGITNANVQQQKSILPALKNYRIQMQNPFVHAGASGVAIDFEFAFDTLSMDEKISITPVMFIDSLFSNCQDYDVVENTTGASDLLINCNNSSGKIKLFVPYWKLKNGCQMGIKLNSVKHDFELAAFMLPESIVVPKINDVDVIFKLDAAAVEDDYEGLKLLTENSIPAHYVADKGLQQLTFKWSLLMSTEIGEKSNMMTQDISAFQTSFYPDGPQFSKSVFVPYYLMHNLRGEQKLIFKQTASITGTDLIIGTFYDTVSVVFPELLQVQVQELQLQLQKMKKTKKLFFEIYHGKRMVYRSDTVKNSKAIVWNTMNSNAFYLHSNDVVSLYLFGKDKRNRETLSYIWAYKGKDFYRIEKSFILNNTAFLKNGKISFFTIKK